MKHRSNKFTKYTSALINGGCALALLIFLGQNTAWAAAPRCEDIFLETSTRSWKKVADLSAYKNQLDTTRLSKEGFETQGKNELYDNQEKKSLGKLRIADSQLLFQWSSPEIHQAVMQRNGVDPRWMKDLVHADPQSAGRGFYVSLSPKDSTEYGSHLTVFETQQPLVLLEVVSEYAAKALQPKDLERLARAGIHGIRHKGYQDTWINIISVEPLTKPTAIPSAAMDILKANATDLLNKPQLQAEIQPVKKFLEEAVWGQKSEALIKFFSNPKNEVFFDSTASYILRKKDELIYQFIPSLLQVKEPLARHALTKLYLRYIRQASYNGNVSRLPYLEEVFLELSKSFNSKNDELGLTGLFLSNWSSLPATLWPKMESNVFSRIALKQATLEDLKYTGRFDLSSTSNFSREWIENFISLSLNAKGPEEFKETLQVVRNLPATGHAATKHELNMVLDFYAHPPKSPKELAYGQILEHFDLTALLQIADKQGNKLSLEAQKKSAKSLDKDLGTKKASTSLIVENWRPQISLIQIAELHTVGTVLKNWIRKAENDNDFILRARWAQKFLNELYPDLK